MVHEVSTWGLLRRSLRLLSRRDQVRLGVITLAQVATGLMDLLGVLLIGLVGALSASAVSGAPLPLRVQDGISAIGLDSTDPLTASVWLISAAGAALIAKSLLSAILARATLRFLARRQAALSAKLTVEYLSQPLLKLQEKSSQDVAFGLTVGVQAATVGILGAASTAAADLGLLVILAIGLGTVDIWVTIFAAAFFGSLAFALQKAMAGWAIRIGEESAEVDVVSYQAIQEAIASYREISVLDRRKFYAARIQRLRMRSADIGATSQFAQLIPKYVFESALILGALLLAVSQFVSKDVAAAVGVVAIFIVAGSRIMPALMRLQTTDLTIRRSAGPSERAISLARNLGPGQESSDRSSSQRELIDWRASERQDFTPTLKVSHAWLTYPGAGRPALMDVSFSAGVGSSVALVGSTGAGKSTLADIVLGVVNPDQGTVEISGLIPREAIAEWPGGISYVPQEVALITGTVRHNVAIGLPSEMVRDDLAWEALERAHLAAFLRDSRDGLDTFIGEGGMRLSGGQRQRLGVARALYSQPRLLVLDEATSALDSETEALIAQTLRDLAGSVTTVTIAHRLATVRHCDIVIYLEEGRVVSQGTFEEVRKAAPAFDRQARLLGL